MIAEPEKLLTNTINTVIVIITIITIVEAIYHLSS